MSNWFYSDRNRQPQGPVSAATLAAMHERGELTPDTLVWRDGLGEWQPFAKVAGEILQPAPATVATSGVARAAIEAGEVVHAGFWKRVAAYLIDGLLLAAVNWLLQILLSLVFAAGLHRVMDSLSDDTFLWFAYLFQGMTLLVTATYFTLMHASSWQATLGKRLIGIKVVGPDGARLGLGHALLRYFASLLSALLLGIGYLLAAFGAEKRALHDLMCHTWVVDRHAYTERPDLQNPKLGVLTWLVLLILGGLLVGALVLVAIIIIALGSGGGWH